MAGIDELLGVGPQPQSTAERIAVDAAVPTGAVGGGVLAGVLGGAVFGGPIGAAIGGIAGLALNRERKNILDAVSNDVRQVSQFGIGVVEQLNAALPYAQKFGTEQDVEQLTDIAKQTQRLRGLASHHDPSVRAMALTQLIAQDGSIQTWREDIETRTETIADREWDLRKEIGTEFRQQIASENEMLVDAMVSGNKLLELTNNLGEDDPSVQAAARQYFGSALADFQVDNVAGSFSLLGFSLSAGTIDKKYSKDEIFKGVGGVMKAERDVRGNRINELGRQAEAEGFEISNQDGSITVKDLDTTVAKFREVKPNANPIPTIQPSNNASSSKGTPTVPPTFGSQRARQQQRTQTQQPTTDPIINAADWVKETRRGQMRRRTTN